MAYCTNCGSPIEEGAKFCTNCGTRLATQSPEKSPFRQPVEPQIIYQAPVTAKRKKHTIPLIVCSIVAVLAIVAAIIAFVGSSDSFTEAGTGTYEAITAEMAGIRLNIDEVYPDGFTVVLKDSGKCTVSVGSKSSSGTWSMDGNTANIHAGGVDLEGTLEDGILTADNVLGSGVTLTFLKEGTTAPVPQSPAESTDAETDADIPALNADWWSGQWYGWWTAAEGTGTYAEWEGSWWDCCAEIECYSDDFLYVRIWDEDSSREEPMAEMDFVLDEGPGEMGIARATEGYFFDMDVAHGSLTMDPSVYNLENTIGLEGDYSDENGTIHFRMYLRPWGQDWSDVELEEYEEIPYTPEDMYPYYYEDWYLPAIRSGQTMPDNIGE